MRAYVANTDYDWYLFLQRQAELEEVNFWKPSGSARFSYLSTGHPFFFKLKQAHNHAIVGFGLFVLFKHLTVGEAWDAFGISNGASSLDDVWARITRYTSHSATESLLPNHRIGCILLATPVFFPKELWVEGPRDWHPNIVTGKGYDTSTGEGKRIWNACLERLNLIQASSLGPATPQMVAEQMARYGEEHLVRPRLGQGIFRYAVQEAYGKCAVTRERSLPALEAAHIVSYAQGGPHEISNGLLLRADIHKLFDRGYVTVTPNYRFRVSPRLADEFHNGRVYYELDGRELWVPKHEEDQPKRIHLERHNEEVFVD